MSRKFEWDQRKNHINQTKHRIAFDDVTEVFDDPDRIQYISNREGERRWKTVGDILGSLISVVYTMRKTVFRIISARRASRKEQRDYRENKAKK